MKKSDMITIPIMATDEMISTAKKDKGVKCSWGSTYTKYKTKYFFKADILNGLLRVFVYNRSDMQMGSRLPKWCIFFSREKEEHRTFDYTTGTWKTGMFSNLPQQWNYEYAMKPCTADSESTQIVKNYLEAKGTTVLEMVKNKQEDIRELRLLRKSKAKIDKVEEAMKKIPKLPKGFEKWAINNAFPEYWIYKGDAPTKKGFCTHCGKESEAFKPVHNNIKVCPHCRTALTIKAFGKQKTLENFSYVTVLQKYDETEYVLRQFSTSRRLLKEKMYEQNILHFTEIRRALLTSRFVSTEIYEYAQFSNTSISMWQSHDMVNGYYYSSMPRAVHYMRNMDTVLKNNPARLANLKDLIPNEPGERINIVFRLQRLYRYPYIEYIYKAGLKNLANEIMTCCEYERLFIKGNLAVDAGMNLKTVLQINGQQLRRLRDIDGGSRVLEFLQKERGEYIKDETLRWINGHNLTYADTNIDITKATITKTVNFIKRECKEKSLSLHDFLRKYEDYLQMAAERGEDVTDEIIWKNHRWDEFHDKYLEEKNRAQNQKRDTEVDTKFKKIAKNYKKNLKRFEYEKDELEIQVPKKASDITLEGRLQHHCVGASDNYMKKMNEDRSFIVFLRKKQAPNRPYYTIEIDGTGNILQWYGAYDRKPDKEIIEPWITKWSKVVSKRANKAAVVGGM